MLTRCRTVDAAEIESARRELQPGEALLVKSRRPPVAGDGLQQWVLVNGPSAFHWVEHLPQQPVRVLQRERDDHQSFLLGYPDLVKRALAHDESALAEAALLIERLREHMRHEESELFPKLCEFLGDSRWMRELGYEHRGIREGLEHYEEFLRACLAGLSRREVEKFELDLYHLFEHHVEREEGAVFPLLERVAPY